METTTTTTTTTTTDVRLINWCPNFAVISIDGAAPITVSTNDPRLINCHQ